MTYVSFRTHGRHIHATTDIALTFRLKQFSNDGAAYYLNIIGQKGNFFLMVLVLHPGHGMFHPVSTYSSFFFLVFWRGLKLPS